MSMRKVGMAAVVFVLFLVAALGATHALYKLGALTGADSFGLAASVVGFLAGFLATRFGGTLGARAAIASAVFMALCESTLVFFAMTPSHLEAFPALEVLGPCAIPLFTAAGSWFALRRREFASA